jgi:hypothetical protein
MQWDYGDGPRVTGRATMLFCAWLAWSRFRVVLPLWIARWASVVMALAVDHPDCLGSLSFVPGAG